MKISVSVAADDVEFLDREAAEGRYASRSAGVAAGIRLLRERELVESYAEAFESWARSGEADLWDGPVGDGLT